MTREAAPRRSRLRKRIRRVWATFGVLAMAALAWSYEAKGVDAFLTGDSDLRVMRHPDHIEFAPRVARQPAELLILPGGMVEPTAYAPLAQAVARAGFRVVVVRYPFLGRHALTEGQRREALDRAATLLQRTRPEVRRVVVGHSFGGVLASRLAAERPELLDALVLIGTTHPRDVDLSRTGLRVTKVLATRDGIAPPARAREFARLLPEDARWVEIEGGNHAGFAHYGPQLGDRRATIGRDAQQRRVVEVLLGELVRLSSDGAPVLQF